MNDVCNRCGIMLRVEEDQVTDEEDTCLMCLAGVDDEEEKEPVVTPFDTDRFNWKQALK